MLNPKAVSLNLGIDGRSIVLRYQLAKAKVEEGKYLIKEDELSKKEEKLRREKTAIAQIRSNKETIYAENSLRAQQHRNKFVSRFNH